MGGTGQAQGQEGGQGPPHIWRVRNTLQLGSSEHLDGRGLVNYQEATVLLNQAGSIGQLAETGSYVSFRARWWGGMFL